VRSRQIAGVMAKSADTILPAESGATRTTFGLAAVVRRSASSARTKDGSNVRQ